MKKTLLIILIILVVLAAAGSIYYFKVIKPNQTEPEPAYNTTKVRTGDIIITASGVGNILPAEKVSIGFQVNGVLQDMLVNLGDPVSQGEILAQLDDAEAKFKLSQIESAFNAYFTPQAINQAELALLNAQTDYEVANINFAAQQTLEPQDAITLERAKLNAAEFALIDAQNYLANLQAGPQDIQEGLTANPGSNLAKLLQAQTDLDQARADLAKYTLSSPISGTITAINAAVGQGVNNAPIITIESLENMVFKFFIEERDLSLIAVGNPIEVNFDAYPEDTIAGVITTIEPVLQTFEGSPVAVAWAELTEDTAFPLLSGMSASVEVISAEAQDALLVPIQALREIAPGSYSVFVVQPDGTLRMVIVTVGLQDYANAQILSGLEPGDIVSTGTVDTK